MKWRVIPVIFFDVCNKKFYGKNRNGGSLRSQQDFLL